MKKALCFILAFYAWFFSFSQVSVNSDSSTAHPSAQLEIKSSNKGLLLPRVATPLNTVNAPAEGLFLYNTTTQQPSYFNGTNWQNLGNSVLLTKYENSKAFFSTVYTAAPNQITHTWLVPIGVTKILVQLWAAGDYGNSMPYTSSNTTISFGGDAGDYASFILDVIPGETLTLNVGKGGSSPNVGGNTSIASPSLAATYEVRKGSTAIYINNLLTTNCSGLLEFVAGQDGGLSKTEYMQAGSSDFRRIITGGNGGDAYPIQKGGAGATVSYNMTDNTVSGGLISVIGRTGSSPGAGGGSSLGLPGAGGAGLIILRW